MPRWVSLYPDRNVARLALALGLVALPFSLAGAYASGWVARTRSTGDVLLRGALVGLSGVVNVCLIGFLLARGGQTRLGTAVLAAGVFLALPALATGAVSAWLHRRLWR